jgi:hypothetical protein
MIFEWLNFCGVLEVGAALADRLALRKTSTPLALVASSAAKVVREARDKARYSIVLVG